MPGSKAEGAAPADAWVVRIEAALDATIAVFARAPRTREGRALLIEARRLRSVVANWRCVPPDPEVRDEMLGKVQALADAAEDAASDPEKVPIGRVPLAKSAAPREEVAATRAREVAGKIEAVDRPPRFGTLVGFPPAEPVGRVEPAPAAFFQGRLEAAPIPLVRRDESHGAAKPAGRTLVTAQTVELTAPVDPLLVVVTDPYSPGADGYRTLRRKLATANARAVAVTSARPEEGKTALALNLALALRESARSPVLLVEACVQKPLVGAMMRFEAPECFLAQLARNAETERPTWVVAEPFPKLHVLAIDPRAPRAPLLDPIAFTLGMESIREAGYEHVILDAPPVLESPDSTVISDAVDAVILSAVTLRSKRRELRDAIAQLEPAPILGVVVHEA